MATRRELLTKLLPATAALTSGLPAGAAMIVRRTKCVFVYDPNRMSLVAARAITKGLAVPAGTPLVKVFCRPEQKPEDAFALFEVEEVENGH